MTPGQYTGQQKITPLSREAHNTGYQAWAKKVSTYYVVVCLPALSDDAAYAGRITCT